MDQTQHQKLTNIQFLIGGQNQQRKLYLKRQTVMHKQKEPQNPYKTKKSQKRIPNLFDDTL